MSDQEILPRPDHEERTAPRARRYHRSRKPGTRSPGRVKGKETSNDTPSWALRRRRRVEITARELRNLGLWLATFKEACAWFRCSPSILTLRLKEDPELRRAWDEGHYEGYLSLRRRQLEIAFSDCPQATQMLIHLGKTVLNQTERSRLEHTGPGGGAIKYSEIRHRIVRPDEREHCPGSDQAS